MLTLVSTLAALGLGAVPPEPIVWYTCPVEPAGPVQRGGGMINDGWDGPGANATTLYWHIENYSNDLPAAQQRDAYIFVLATWASVVQIHFVEIAAPNWNRSIDFRWATGDHCAIEAAECGVAECAFDGPGGTVAHAGFPPGAASVCVNPMSESFAGNVHFDDAELYEQDVGNPGVSLMLVAAHEVGHSLGLIHDEGPGGPHIMRPTVSSADGMQAPSASDIAHLQQGYAAGIGSVTTLEDSGLWVNSAWPGASNGLAGNPFRTVSAAVAALPPQNDGITIHVLGGSYPGSLTIAVPCTITAEFGTARIGH
ncbi:MAG: matrixin family metalloprotease [Phycisphaeraceae bacterium]|nr:matrixin family metalloprotease [Phycisphaeraceae bacterium]MCW5762726.1 matrixin family metalloprotease [Phycisphaeraceae bacterium]